MKAQVASDLQKIDTNGLAAEEQARSRRRSRRRRRQRRLHRRRASASRGGKCKARIRQRGVYEGGDGSS